MSIIFRRLRLAASAVCGFCGLRRLRFAAVAVRGVCGLRRLRFVGFAICGGWGSRFAAVAVGGVCGLRRLRFAAFSVCGGCGLRRLRFAGFVVCGVCGLRRLRFAGFAAGGVCGWRRLRLAAFAVGGVCGLRRLRFAAVAECEIYFGHLPNFFFRLFNTFTFRYVYKYTRNDAHCSQTFNISPFFVRRAARLAKPGRYTAVTVPAPGRSEGYLPGRGELLGTSPALQTDRGPAPPRRLRLVSIWR